MFRSEIGLDAGMLRVCVLIRRLDATIASPFVRQFALKDDLIRNRIERPNAPKGLQLGFQKAHIDFKIRASFSRIS